MARLNEPAIPSESIDALKRRFVRQNRELARTNSNQGQRIRTLETEVSRMLAENLSLREQIINLTQDAEREQLSRQLGDEVLDVKGRLEAKLADIGSLIQELGVLPQKMERRVSRARLSVATGEKTSPDVRNWKNTMTLGEVTSGQRIDHGQEGRLPVIIEDKYYPRRTMDNEEGLGLLSGPAHTDLIESPDLGPPPVAHFDEEEPIKFDPDQNGPTMDVREDLDDDTVFLPPNLETRRRRRDSSSTKTSSSLSTTPNLLQGNGITTGSSLKSGAKRKLSMLEEVRPTEMPPEPTEDDFQFNRKNGDTAPSSPKREVPDKASKENTNPIRLSPGKAKSSPRKEGGANRRVLGPKSVNTDPLSPFKATKLSVSDKIAVLKEDVARQSKARQQAREKKNGIVASIETHTKPTEELSSSDQLPEAPPKTPAGLDIFSPASTEPSTRAESRDTPPPGELKMSAFTGDATGSFGRASRRPKGSVSYAEPNLRDKMRRPTKELADAVTGERFQRSTSVHPEDEMEGDVDVTSSLELNKLRTVIVKRDDKVERQARAADSGSPLGAKSNGSAVDLPTSVLTERKRRASAACKGQEPSSRDTSSKAEPSDSEDWQRDTRNAGGQPADLEVAMGKLDIFDGPSSSPQPETAATEIENENEKECPASRTSRRHSSVTGLSKDVPLSGNSTSIRLEQIATKPTGPRVRPALATRPERDRSENRPQRTKGDADLKGVKGIASMKDASVAGGRADRAAARRRSMML